MGHKHKSKTNISQVSLELAVVFASIALFFAGTARLWVWSNAQLVGRTRAYQDTRLLAGTEGGYAGFWGDGSTEDTLRNAQGIYTPHELTEEYIFSGDTSSGSPAQINLPSGPPPTLGRGIIPFLNFDSDDFSGYDFAQSRLEALLSGLDVDYEAIEDGMDWGTVDTSGVDFDDVFDEVTQMIAAIDITNCSSLEAAIAEIDARIGDVEEGIAGLQDQLSIYNSALWSINWQIQMKEFEISNVEDGIYRSINNLAWDGTTDPLAYRDFCGRCEGSCLSNDYSASDRNRVISCLNEWLVRYDTGYASIYYSCEYANMWMQGEAVSGACFPSCTVIDPCTGTYHLDSGYGSREEMAEDYFTFFIVTDQYTNTDLRITLYDYTDFYVFHDNPYWWGTGHPTYHPGMQDLLARQEAVQDTIDEFDDAIDEGYDAIYDLQVQRYSLLENARDVGCEFVPEPFPYPPIDPNASWGWSGWL